MADEIHDQLELLLDRSTSALGDIIARWAFAVAHGADITAEARLKKAGSIIAASQALADLLGRQALLRLVERRAKFNSPRSVTPVVPDVPFLEAVQSLIDRTPALATDWEEVSKIYTTDYGFALAKSLEPIVTENVQRVIADAIEQGIPRDDAVQTIADIGAWPRSYAQTVYRTNVATAYAAGLWKKARDPELAELVGGFRYVTAGDVDVRASHKMLDGIVAAIDDKIWDRISTPRGFQCRCSLELVDPEELEAELGSPPRKARIPLGWQADKGFDIAVRPDKRFYGG